MAMMNPVTRVVFDYTPLLNKDMLYNKSEIRE